jgi:hypothetical protein
MTAGALAVIPPARRRGALTGRRAAALVAVGALALYQWRAAQAEAARKARCVGVWDGVTSGRAEGLVWPNALGVKTRAAKKLIHPALTTSLPRPNHSHTPPRRRKAAAEAAANGGDGADSGALVVAGPRKKARPPKDAALRELARFLLPIAGRRVGGLVALAILRTALSNRLARVQVSECVWR